MSSDGSDPHGGSESDSLLARERKRAQQYLDIAAVMIVALDAQAQVVMINRKGREILGYPEAEILGKRWFEHFVPERHRASVAGIFCQIMAGAQAMTESLENPVLTRGGQERLMAWHNAAVRDAQGAIVGTLSSGMDITERAAADLRLRESEETFRTFFDNAPVAKAMTAPDGRLLRVNAALCSLLRYAQEELQSLNFASITHPDDLAETNEQVRRLVAGERDASTWEKRYVTKDGQTVWTQVTTRLQRDRAGRPLHFLTHVLDITARKRGEEVLRASEEEFRTIFENSSSAMAIIERDTTISMVNREYCRVGGYEERDVIGRSWTTQIPPDDLERLQEYNRARLIDPKSAPEKYEFRFYRKDGQIRDCLMSVAVLPRSQQILSSFVDITEHRRAQEDLARSAQEWQRTFDAANDAIWILDENQRVLRSNKAAERFFHRPYQEFVGLHCWEIVHGTSEPIPDCPIVRARKSLRRETIALELGEVWVEVTVDPVLNAAGRYAGAVHMVSDITQRTQERQERERLQASLAQSDRLASMGMLAAGVAHEINNPLAYVLYNVESLAQDLPKLAAAARRCSAALREQVTDAEFAEIAGEDVDVLQPAALDDAIDRAKEALSGARRIKEVARGLSTFSRVERVEQSRIQLRYPIESAINMAFNEIKYRARLVKDFGKVPPIWASEGKVAQIFLNLLINAAHAIDEGDVDGNRITVRTYTEGDDVLAEVADTGRGILPEDLDRIFEPFFTTKGAGKGSGLGLAICRNLVAELGGDIRVESELGKGTRFVVRLPAKRPELEEQPEEAVPEGPRTPSVRGRILVVDDEPPVRAALQRLLGREHEVVSADSGRAAQALLETDASFDLILCDLMMPEMTGMDLHKWLAERNASLAAQMVFVTGGAFTPKATEYLARLVNLKIEKPFDADNLTRLVAALIAAARSNPQKIGS